MLNKKRTISIPSVQMVIINKYDGIGEYPSNLKNSYVDIKKETENPE